MGGAATTLVLLLLLLLLLLLRRLEIAWLSGPALLQQLLLLLSYRLKSCTILPISTAS
jgi:hypothetical protein